MTNNLRQEPIGLKKGQLIRHRNATRKKTKTRISITLKLNLPEVGSVIRTKDNNYKEIYHNLQENVLKT